MQSINASLVILLVEDSEDDVFFMKRALKAAGVENPLHVARDGQEAIDYLSGAGDFSDRSIHPLPSLILLDLKLPYQSGLEVLKWMREQPQNDWPFVIVLTSSREPNDLKMAYQFGAKSYLVKPSSADTLSEMVQAFKHYWLNFNQFPQN
jgi:CheY-like chemotaxis protein